MNSTLGLSSDRLLTSVSQGDNPHMKTILVVMEKVRTIGELQVAKSEFHPRSKLPLVQDASK